MRISVYDLLGRQVSVLVDGIHPQGDHEVVFDGAQLAAGVNLCRMEAGISVLSKALVLVR